MTDQELTPKEVGGFRILRRLASGATSDVLLARAEGPHGFQRIVALKILLTRKTGDTEFETRFAAQASAYARLANPAVVKLYDFFSADGQLVMVLEYVDGVPLHKLRAMLAISGERIEDKASIYLGLRVFSALAAAHGARDPARGEFAPIIHYDLNPSNILVPWDGQVKVGDFGIAHAAGLETDARAGFIKGTYGYSAPEQVSGGKEVTLRADVYAAGLILWELLARRKAVQRGNLNDAQVLKAMAHPEFPSLDVLRPDLGAPVRAAIKRALEPDPEKRSITADEMVTILTEAAPAEDGRKALAKSLVKLRASAPADGGAPEPPRPARAAPAPTPDERLDPEQTAPFAAITEDNGDLGKIAFYGRIKLPGDPSDPPQRRSSVPPPPAAATVPTLDAGPPTAPVPAMDAAPTVTPPRPSPRPPPGERHISEFPTAQATAPQIAVPASPLGPQLGSTLPTTPGLVPMLPFVAAPPSPAPAPEPHPAATPPMTERSPIPSDSPPAAAPAPVEDAIAATPAAPANPNAPPYVHSSLPPPETGRGFPWMGAAVVGLVLAGAGAYFLHRGSSEEPAATAHATSAVSSTPPAASVPSVAPPEPATSVAASGASSPPSVASAEPSSVPPSSASAAPSSAPSAATAHPSVAAGSAAPSPSAAPPPPAEEPLAADTGEIELPASAAGHRVFIDGKVAGEGTAPIRLHCGSHVVKVGSAGTEKKVKVPCAGTLSL